MAYIQSEKPVSRWSKIVLTYKKIQVLGLGFYIEVLVLL